MKNLLWDFKLVTKFKNLICGAGLLMVCFNISGCSSSILPWPSLSVSHDEARGALSKKEQNELKDVLAEEQKNHAKDAAKEIEQR